MAGVEVETCQKTKMQLKRRSTSSGILKSDEATSKQARREKNREAQNAFRKRRQAAEAAQTRRVKRLEEVVEEISGTFVGFLDELMQIDSIIAQHPKLINSLRKSVVRVLALAREVVDDDDDDAEPLPLNVQLFDSQAQQPSGTKDDSEERLQLAPFAPETHEGFMEMCDPMAFYEESSSINCLTSFAMPLSFVGSLIESPCASVKSLLQPLDGFPLRLLETTLLHAYYTLISDNVGPSCSLMLRFRRKEELVSTILWLLGPGKDYIYRASGFAWGSQNGRVAVFPPHNSLENDAEFNKVPECLTVLGISEHLQNLGARVVDSDTIEVNVHGTGPLSDESILKSSIGLPLQQPSPWNYFDWTAHRPLGSITMRLSISLLITNLAQRAMCFVRGPGYPRNELGRVLAASVALTR